MLEHGWENKWDNKWTAAGRGWWANGALVVEEDGAALVDADGGRHPLDLPAFGGRLIKAGEPAIHLSSGGAAESAAIFVADETGHPVLRIPAHGFDDQGLRQFAAAAGLTYEVYHLSLGKTDKFFPHLLRSPGLGGAVHDRAQRDRRLSGRVRRLFGGAPHEEQPPPPLPDQTAGADAGDDNYRAELDAAMAEANRLLADLQNHPLDTSLPPGPAHDAAVRDHQARTDALEAVNQRVRALITKQQAKLDERPPREVDAEPVVGPPAYTTEVAFRALLEASFPLPRLVARAETAGAAGAVPQATPVDVNVLTAPPRTLADRLRLPQLPMPLIASDRSYRIRAAFAPNPQGPRLVATMDEATAAAAGTHVAMPAGDATLPAWWTQAVGQADGCRECMLVVAREAWAALGAGGGTVTAYLL
jgi:hypothetical protein